MRDLLVICNTGRLSLSSAMAALVGGKIGEHVLSVKNEEARRNRLASYLILKGALSGAGLMLVDLDHGERGEPIAVLENGTLNVSISHSGEVTAVALSDSMVGVDAEGEIEEVSAERIKSRFINGRGLDGATDLDTEIDFVLAHLSETGELIVTASFTDVRENSEKAIYVNNNLHINRISPFGNASAEWTVLEAVLKTYGGGFSDFLNTGAIASAASIASYRISTDKETLYLTLAKE